MKISLLTPTADRPIPFALCERWMARQSVQFDEWIVADGGQTPATCTLGQIHVHDPRPPGAENFAHNLLNGMRRASGDAVVVIEDDDYYTSTHVESILAALNSSQHALIAGCYPQHYYHVGRRAWRTMQNREHSSLCQTAIRRVAVPIFQATVEQCLAGKSFVIDFALWKAIARAQWARVEAMTCIGIKGLPGTEGLGIGHKAQGGGWTIDPEFRQLHEWIGSEDAWVYRSL